MAETPRGWLLDTNVVSEMRKGKRADRNVAAWAQSVPPIACFLSVVSVAEIRFGIVRVPDPGFRAELEAWLQDGVRVWFGERLLRVDENVLMQWRRLAWEGKAANYTYSQPDALIAATALAHGLAVVTRNTADFDRAGIPLLNPWTAATSGPP